MALAVLAALLAVVPQGVNAHEGHFSDVQDHWAHDRINYLMDVGILGDANSTWCGPSEFCPDRPIARWMAAVWLVRALGGGQDPDPVAETSFSDVSPGDFWAPHIERLAELGLTEGYPDGTFRPHVPVLRRHMNLFLQRGEGNDAIPANPAALRHGAVVMLRTCRDGGNHCPAEEVTRGESASILAAALQGDLDQSPTAAPAGQFWEVHEGLSAGNYHTCALRHGGQDDDRIACWGINSHGQLDQPHPDYRYKLVASGGAHSCAIRRDNIMDCWGFNNHGQTDVPEGRYKNVAAGDVSTCAIRTDHKLVCWGKNHGDMLHRPPPHSFDNLDVGATHACAIRRARITDSNRKKGYCWGLQTAGEFDVARKPPPHESGVPHYLAIATGNAVTCGAINFWRQLNLFEGTVEWALECWGSNEHGHHIRQDYGANIRISIRNNAVDVGWWHACALQKLGVVMCWGSGTDQGQQNVPPGGRFNVMTVGAAHTCATKLDLGIACWGFEF